MAGHAANDKQFILVEHSGMPVAAFGDRPRYLWLSPMGRIEIKYYKIRQVGSVLVLAAEYKKLVPLIESGRMT